MPPDLTPADRLADAMSRIYDRPQPPVPWRDGASLPWDDPAFSERMLAQHLDPSHGAASRPLREIRAQVQQMMGWLELGSGSRLLDVTCGPGLYAAEFAKRGVAVTGIDFGPASIAHARELCRGDELPSRGEGLDLSQDLSECRRVASYHGRSIRQMLVMRERR